MAETTKKNTPKLGARKKDSLIDPIYQKYTKSVIRALGSTEFYEFFMDAISRADNQFQFSNRKMEKTVDLNWVDAVEDSLPAFQNIVSNPRNVIREDELIVNVAHAKKGGADVVRHLAQHSAFVEKFDEVTGDVRPNKLMQKYREDTVGLYENRLVFTTLENAYHFVKIRHDALFEAMSDEFGAKLKVDSTMETATELVRMDMFLHIKETDSALETDEKNGEVFGKISRMYRVLNMLMRSQFAQQMAKLPRIKGAITKTNVLKKNPSYRKIVQLMEFLREYDDIGYTIRVVEQNPQINEILQQDIYHNILFNYLILKGYLAIPWITDSVTIGGASTERVTILTPILTLVLVFILVVFIQKSKVGMAMRAVSKDFETSQLMGIRINKIISFTFIIGSFLASVGSTLYFSKYSAVTPTVGAMPGLKAFVAAVFGGIGSIPGAVVGAFIIGICENILKAVGLTAFSDAFTFALLIIILVVKPTGLFGENVAEKV